MTSSSNGAFPQAELQGAIYCWVAGKAPKTDKWNERQNLLTLQQIQEGPKPSWATGYGMVSGRYSGFLCVDVDTKPERPEQPNVTFRGVAKKDIADLPPSATVISGKKGRQRIYLRVPSDWYPDLSGYSLNRGDLELRWEKGSPDDPRACQSVISGPHPEGGDLHFRWADGLRPEEVGIADCPVWLLRGMVLDHQRAQINAELAIEKKETRSADGELTPIEKLTPAEQVQVLQEMSKFWPYRGGLSGTRFQASYEADGYNSLLGALFNLFGDELAYLYLADTEWFKSSEDFGSSPDFHKALRSVGKSKTEVEAGWGTLHYLATRSESVDGTHFKEPGFRWPKHLHPPIEVKVHDMAKRTVEMMGQLVEAMEVIDQFDTSLERTIAYQNLQKTLGCNQQEYRELLNQLEIEKRPRVGGSLSEVCANAKEIRPVIERLLPENCITIIASESGVGKSALIYRMAVAGAYGGKLFGQLQAEKGNVLIVQTDESDSNLKSKIKQMDIADPEGRIRVEFQFSAGHFPELRKWIREHKAKYVLMDSLGSLFAGEDISANMIGTYIYNLNDIAAEEGCAIVLTQPEEAGKEKAARTTVNMSDLYGNQYITAGASDVWGITKDPESDPANPQFLLKVIKPRSSVTQAGDEFKLSGNLEDLSFELAALNGDEKGISKLNTAQKLVVKELKGRALETGLSLSELAASTGQSVTTLRRVTGELYRRHVVCRGLRASGTGRPGYVFWT